MVASRLVGSRRSVDVAELVEQARAGQPRAVARLISLVESGGPSAEGAAGAGSASVLREVAAALAPYGGHAQVVGLTGSPGVGKSTTTSALVSALRADGKRVGVLAVDPSSPFSGGALLGDRVRLAEHAGDSGVFIRSMASRGQLGGLAAAASRAVRVLDAAGYDVIIVETVGVGQSEIDIARLADTTVLLLAPGMGDEIQAAKAGVVEIADVLVVNKADRDGASRTVRELRQMLALAGPPEDGAWSRPILRTTASRGEGVDELVATLDRHREWLEHSGEREQRRVARTRAEIEGFFLMRIRERLAAPDCAHTLTGLAAEVVAGGLDPRRAVEALAEIVSAPTPTTPEDSGH
ncbi:MAG TPA: methylmalonyl Co-A mutase-associated GTPase MeaB [Amycolatopsis sp.]|nr:methylmalonyl Co-A mutase-associated GTPase MeaB [Amycolatopsis sp.]